MKLNQLPQLASKPNLRSAEGGLEFSEAKKVQAKVTDAFNASAAELAGLDNDVQDYNLTDGEVLSIDNYYSFGGDDSCAVQSAEIIFDKETGSVDKFKLIKPNGDSVSYEHVLDDEYRSSNPTFEVVENGQRTSYEMNPDSGSITAFTAH